MSVPGEKLTFVHGFGRGVLCELEVSAQPPTKGEQLHLNIAWTGRPKSGTPTNTGNGFSAPHNIFVICGTNGSFTAWA